MSELNKLLAAWGNEAWVTFHYYITALQQALTQVPLTRERETGTGRTWPYETTLQQPTEYHSVTKTQQLTVLRASLDNWTGYMEDMNWRLERIDNVTVTCRSEVIYSHNNVIHSCAEDSKHISHSVVIQSPTRKYIRNSGTQSSLSNTNRDRTSEVISDKHQIDYSKIYQY